MIKIVLFKLSKSKVRSVAPLASRGIGSYGYRMTDAVTAFGWEPKGERFVLITTNDPNHGQVAPGVLLKSSVAFYGFDARKGDFLQLSVSLPSFRSAGARLISFSCDSIRNF